MDVSALAVPSAGLTPATTARREWWGWTGAMSWLFFMMYGFDSFAFHQPPVNYDLFQVSTLVGDLKGGVPAPFFFMIVAAAAIALSGWLFRRDPDKLSRVAFFTGPVAIVFTAVFAFLPRPVGETLYVLSPILFAPSLARRVFGVLHTSASGNRVTRYMGGVAAGIAVLTLGMVVWTALAPPDELAFFIPALIAIPSWVGVRRRTPLPEEKPKTVALSLSRGYIIILFAAMVAALFVSTTLSSVLHSHFVYGGMDQNLPTMVLGFLLPAIAFTAYGIINDGGFERFGFICGMGLYLIGILFALLPGGEGGGLSLFLAFSEGFGGSYTEFFILTIPVFLFVGSKKPVFAATLGVVANLISSAFLWVAGAWLPEDLREPGAPLYVSAAVATVLLIVMIYLVFERHREKTLVSALHTLLLGTGKALPAAAAPAPSPITFPTTQVPQASDTGQVTIPLLSREESDVALLLIEGTSRSEIMRRLRLTAAELDRRLMLIRDKVGGDACHPDPAISIAAARFKLTRREADMLGCLRAGMTNVEIAAGLFLSESTVKNHVHNLMRKIPVEGRLKIPEWLFALEHGVAQ